MRQVIVEQVRPKVWAAKTACLTVIEPLFKGGQWRVTINQGFGGSFVYSCPTKAVINERLVPFGIKLKFLSPK